jgi:hypothetical protein
MRFKLSRPCVVCCLKWIRVAFVWKLESPIPNKLPMMFPTKFNFWHHNTFLADRSQDHQ